MNTLVILSVVDIVLLIAGLAFYLFIVGGHLTRVAANLEECAELVRTVKRNAEAIDPGLDWWLPRVVPVAEELRRA